MIPAGNDAIGHGCRRIHDCELHDACRVGDIRRIKSIIRDGCDINAKDINGNTALHAACEITNTGYNIDRVYMVELLLDVPQIDINVANIEYETPCSLAFGNGLFHICHQIRAHLSAANITIGEFLAPFVFDKTILHRVISDKIPPCVLEELLEANLISIDSVPETDWDLIWDLKLWQTPGTALMVACASGNEADVVLLLKYGANAMASIGVEMCIPYDDFDAHIIELNADLALCEKNEGVPKSSGKNVHFTENVQITALNCAKTDAIEKILLDFGACYSDNAIVNIAPGDIIAIPEHCRKYYTVRYTGLRASLNYTFRGDVCIGYLPNRPHVVSRNSVLIYENGRYGFVDK